MEKNSTSNPFDTSVYLIRTNLFSKDAKNPEEITNWLYENNIVSINIRDYKSDDTHYFEDIFNGKAVKYDPKKKYINRFYDLAKLVKSSDVIVIASYLGISPKIGLIKRGAEYFCEEKEHDYYKFCCFRLEDVRDFDLRSYPILRSIIPQQITISPVKKRKNVIHHLYYGTPIPFELSSMSEASIETMCAEYLRSHISGQSLRTCYQITQTGGNYPDVDIIGYNNQDELIIAQISYTDNERLINEKKEKLGLYGDAKHKIMFSTLPTDMNTEPLNINIQDVWDYFAKDEIHRKFLERLIGL